MLRNKLYSILLYLCYRPKWFIIGKRTRPIPAKIIGDFYYCPICGSFLKDMQLRCDDCGQRIELASFRKEKPMCENFVCTLSNKCINEPICNEVVCPRKIHHQGNLCNLCQFNKQCHRQPKQKLT